MIGGCVVPCAEEGGGGGGVYHYDREDGEGKEGKKDGKVA